MGAFLSKVEWDFRITHFILSSSLDTWKLYLNYRQLEFILMKSQLPDVLVGSMTQANYNALRWQATLFILMRSIFFTLQLYVDIRGLEEGYPSLIYSWSRLFSRRSQLRAILYSAIDSVVTMAPLLPIVLILAVVNDQVSANPVTLIVTGTVWLLGGAINAAIKTAFLIELTDKMGIDAFIIAAFFSESFVILKHILFIQVLAPLVLQPLPPGEAKMNIDAVADKAGYYPTHLIYLEPNVKGQPEKNPNAYQVGIFYNSMIIVSESLLNMVGPKDIAAVVAHELGHWYFSHTAYGFLSNLVSNLCFLAVATLCYTSSSIYDVFNFNQSDDQPHPIIGVLLGNKYIFPLVDAIVIGSHGIVSYFCEYAADGFAVTMGLGRELKRALVTVMAKTRSFPGADDFFAAWFHGHPSIVKRAQILSVETISS